MVGILRVQSMKPGLGPEIEFQEKWLDPLFMWVSHLPEDQVLLTRAPRGDASLSRGPHLGLCSPFSTPSPISPFSASSTIPLPHLPLFPTSLTSHFSISFLSNDPKRSSSRPLHSFIYSLVHSQGLRLKQ